jgi:hypothetical protein
VARSDKAVEAESLSYLRRAKSLNKGVVDQWGLVHVGLACLQESNKMKYIWTNSFRACNMDPRTQLSFPEWCVKINSFLQGGDSFKPEVAENDPYLLLPAFWLGMEPSEKRNAVAALNKHKNPWSAECIQALRDELNIPFKDMQNLRMCIDHAEDNPSDLERGLPSDDAIQQAKELPPQELKDAIDDRKDANHGLVNYMLKPSGLKGEQLLTHMIQHRMRTVPDEKHRISDHLLVSPKDKHQANLLEKTAASTIFGNIMREIGGTCGTMRLAKRKLDFLGTIKSHSGFVNDPVRLERYEKMLRLAKSIEEVKEIEENMKKTKELENKDELETFLEEALLKMKPETEAVGSSGKKKSKKKKGDVSNLTKKEIASILLFKFNIVMDHGSKNKKELLVLRLQKEIESNLSWLN